MMSCVETPNCYYDDYAVQINEPVSCSQERKSCFETGDDGIDQFTKGEVWGYSHDWASNKMRSLASDYCKGDTLIEYACGKDGFIVEEEIECDSGCTQGKCVKKVKPPVGCGNFEIDHEEECDSGALNGQRSFCTNQCTFDWNNGRIPVTCQIYSNEGVERPMECSVFFGKLSGRCAIATGQTSCKTEMVLPSNNNQTHYHKFLYGSLDDIHQKNVAYNGINYILNFDILEEPENIDENGDVSSNNIPPAGYEDEVLVDYSAYNNPFPDTSVLDLSGRAAAELYRRAVIGGYPDGEFKGYRDVNRAEAAKFLLLARYGGVNDLRNNGRFPDVLDGQWYTKYVVTAADKGIISGHPDGTFRPANTVNTAEFLKMLSLTFGLQLNLQYSYTDVSSQDWFAPYAGIAERYNLFPGRSAYLSPGDPLTREEVAVAIYQYLQNR